MVPTVIIGLGSSGKHVVTNVAKIMYEVLNGDHLPLFEYLTIDTDDTRRDDELPPSAIKSKNISAKVENIALAYASLKQVLKASFDWCPPDLQIGNQGAGNLRAGGRLMLFEHMSEIKPEIQSRIADVVHNGGLNEVQAKVRGMLRARGIVQNDAVVDTISPPAVYVTGTLAGGTCSGMCVDLGYAIRDVHPTCLRVGIFFIPDTVTNVPPLYLANSWATMQDLAYFCRHPEKFTAVWKTRNNMAQTYQGGARMPYDQIYILSPADQNRTRQLPYDNRSDSPLLVMTAMQLAANLLGMHGHRQSKLEDTFARLIPRDMSKSFLNFNLRAICYPKYDITEAASCNIIASRICPGWLDQEHYTTTAGPQPLVSADVAREGARFWNDTAGKLWDGVRAGTKLNELVDDIVTSKLGKQTKEVTLKRFRGNETEDFFTIVAENANGQLSQFKKTIQKGVIGQLASSSNFKYARLFLDGIRSEVLRTAAYWSELKVPEEGDFNKWKVYVEKRVDRILSRQDGWMVLTLNERVQFLRDEFGDLLMRLEMFHMRITFARLVDWMGETLDGLLGRLRVVMESVQTLAGVRSLDIVNRLETVRPPVLRISRSTDEGFRREIADLSRSEVTIDPPLVKQPGSLESISPDGTFSGVLGEREDTALEFQHEVLLKLKRILQPQLLKKLEAKGPIDIGEEMRKQGYQQQAADNFANTTQLSVACATALSKDREDVPAFILARSETVSLRVDGLARERRPSLPQMNLLGLPMFDHMAIFYQEGACFAPEDLRDAEVFKSAYEERKKAYLETLDPLRFLKTAPGNAKGDAVGG